jgi:transglutaminase-like putative cysteine protease
MNYLSPGYFFDFEESVIQEIIDEIKSASISQKDRAIGLYYKIRDGWWYNPYHISLSKKNYKSSIIAKRTEAHCIEKAILLISCLRGLNIPSRIHLVKVKNHIGAERLLEKFGTNEMTPHGMVDIYLEDKWLKVSPAFNASLCEKYNVSALDFDGEHDSMFQEFDKKGNVFMEYIEDYGFFDDVPTDFIFKNFKENYPRIFEMFDGSSDIKL